VAINRSDAEDAGGLAASMSEVDVATGHVSRMAGKRWRTIRNHVWLPDESGLLLVAQEKSGVQDQIWLVAYPGGERRRISNDLLQYRSVSISGDGKSIVATQWDESSNLWAAPANSPDAASRITSGHIDGGHGLTILPNNQVVYTTDHAENWDLFIVDMDGQNGRQLSFDGRFHNSPTACENGHSIVYDTDSLGVTHLWKLDLTSGSSVQLTNGIGESDAACALTGDMIYYRGKTSSGQERIFKMNMTGTAAMPLSDEPPIGPPHVSPDGKHVLFAASRKDGARVALTLSAETGKVESEYPVPPTTWWYGATWLPDNRSFAAQDMRSGVANLWAWPVLGGGSEKQITHYKTGNGDFGQYSPDGKWLVVMRGPFSGDAVLFREGSK
jgi:Tol biopolymer transport system component